MEAPPAGTPGGSAQHPHHGGPEAVAKDSGPEQGSATAEHSFVDSVDNVLQEPAGFVNPRPEVVGGHASRRVQHDADLEDAARNPVQPLFRGAPLRGRVWTGAGTFADHGHGESAGSRRNRRETDLNREGPSVLPHSGEPDATADTRRRERARAGGVPVGGMGIPASGNEQPQRAAAQLFVLVSRTSPPDRPAAPGDGRLPGREALVPGLRMVVVAGPRIDPAALPAHDRLEVRGYVHDLYRQLAACDLAVVQGGLTTTMELTAARRPFSYVPLRHHFEQNFHVRHRLGRYRAGRCLDCQDTGPESLAQAIAEEAGRPVRYRPVETDEAAHRVHERTQRPRPAAADPRGRPRKPLDDGTLSYFLSRIEC
jgi:hypothetical protein